MDKFNFYLQITISWLDAIAKPFTVLWRSSIFSEILMNQNPALLQDVDITQWIPIFEENKFSSKDNLWILPIWTKDKLWIISTLCKHPIIPVLPNSVRQSPMMGSASAPLVSLDPCFNSLVIRTCDIHCYLKYIGKYGNMIYWNTELLRNMYNKLKWLATICTVIFVNKSCLVNVLFQL